MVKRFFRLHILWWVREQEIQKSKIFIPAEIGSYLKNRELLWEKPFITELPQTQNLEKD